MPLTLEQVQRKMALLCAIKELLQSQELLPERDDVTAPLEEINLDIGDDMIARRECPCAQECLSSISVQLDVTLGQSAHVKANKFIQNVLRDIQESSGKFPLSLADDLHFGKDWEEQEA